MDWLAVGLTLGWTAVLLALSLARYTGYNAGMFDIGNMAQSIWNGTQGRPLTFTSEQGAFSRMALHVELIYWLFVPLYALWPDPRLLLTLQVAGFAAGAWPLYRLARRRLHHQWAARGLLVCYLFYPTAQNAILFDFHGDTLAIPFLLLALDALDCRAWRTYALWILLALSCKFYVAVPVGALGVTLWLKGERRVGLATALGAAVWLSVTFLIIRPLFAPPEAAVVNATTASYINFYFGQILRTLPVTWLPRLLTAVIVLLPTLWLGWRAPLWLVPVSSVVLPALLSTGPGPSYGYRYHHYALAVPFQLFAILQGAQALRERQMQVGEVVKHRGRPWQGELFLTAGMTLIFAVGLVDIPFNPRFWMAPPGWGLDQWAYGRTARDAFKDAWLVETVPPEVPLAASLFLAPHVANRETLYLSRYPEALTELHQPDHLYQTRYLMEHPESLDHLQLAQSLSEVDYVLTDALFDYAVLLKGGLTFGGVLYDVPAIMLLLGAPEFGLVTAQDGLLWFVRDPQPSARLLQQVERLPGDAAPAPLAVFDEALALLEVELTRRDAERFRLRCVWQPLPDLENRALFAVSWLEGVPHSRVPHLPTLALYPTVVWEPGEAVQETFDFTVPPGLPPGEYTVWTGWYDGANVFAASTDARSQVGEAVPIAVLTME